MAVVLVSRKDKEGRPFPIYWGGVHSRALADYLENPLGLTRKQADAYDLLRTEVVAHSSEPTATVSTSAHIRVGDLEIWTTSGTEPIHVKLKKPGDTVEVFEPDKPDLPELRFTYVNPQPNS